MDCQWSKWGTWGKCLGDCGLGKMVRSRVVLQNEKNGGQPCHGNENSEKSCQLPPCQPHQFYFGIEGQNVALNTSTSNSKVNIEATENNNYGYPQSQLAQPQSANHQPTNPVHSQPALPQPAYPQHVHPQPANSQPFYPQQPVYPKPVHSQPVYPQSITSNPRQKYGYQQFYNPYGYPFNGGK